MFESLVVLVSLDHKTSLVPMVQVVGSSFDCRANQSDWCDGSVFGALDTQRKTGPFPKDKKKNGVATTNTGLCGRPNHPLSNHCRIGSLYCVPRRR